MSLVAPLPLMALSAAFDPGTLGANLANIGLATVAAVAYSALLATIAAFAIWGRLLTNYPASAVAPFFLLVPVFGISLSVLLLGESGLLGKSAQKCDFLFGCPPVSCGERSDHAKIRGALCGGELGEVL